MTDGQTAIIVGATNEMLALAEAWDTLKDALEIPECDRAGCPVCAKQFAAFKAAVRSAMDYRGRQL